MLISAAAGLLAACAPISPERAAEICEERARAALHPTGEVRMGVNSEQGIVGGIELGVTSDFLRGRDPYQVYESCVRQKTGQGPIRPPELTL